jgi:hypothetical protein
MTITYIPFEELFAPEYQLTYISTNGHIDVGPNTYSVFHAYTMTERQQIFQVCEKHLPWETTQEQEQWERTMYMYQFIIKSPPPFPYSEYPLSEEIIMPLADTKKCQTLINIVAEQVKLLKVASTILLICRQAYQDQNVNPTGTPLDGHILEISNWVDDVELVANNMIANGFINNIVPSHRNKALGEL